MANSYSKQKKSLIAALSDIRHTVLQHKTWYSDGECVHCRAQATDYFKQFTCPGCSVKLGFAEPSSIVFDRESIHGYIAK